MSERRPGGSLSGCRVLLTRPGEQGLRTAELLRERGAEPRVMPTIVIEPAADRPALEHALAHLGDYDWIAFTSENGVARSFAALGALGLDASARGTARIAAIGAGTAAALGAAGAHADLVAPESRGEGLAAAMLEAMAPGARVLILRAAEAREVLPDTLRARGCVVDVVAAYRTVAAPPEQLGAIAQALEAGEIDAALFTSASTLRTLCAYLGPRAAVLLGRVRVATIGPVTTQAAAAQGVRVDAEAREPTPLGLARALEASYCRD